MKPGYCSFCQKYSGNELGVAPGWAHIYQNQVRSLDTINWVFYLMCPDCLRKANLLNDNKERKKDEIKNSGSSTALVRISSG